MRDQGIVSASLREEERQFETTLRPNRLADFAGQTKVKENLSIAIEAAKRRGEAMDHVLLYGPPGLGKTTLAGIIAGELGCRYPANVGARACFRRSSTWWAFSATFKSEKFSSWMRSIASSRMWRR